MSARERMLLLLIVLILVLIPITLFEYGNQLSNLQQELKQLREENTAMQNKLNEFLQTWDIGQYESTAYSPYDDRNGLNCNSNPNITATGTKPQQGTIAVNFETFPPGTKMYIQGYGWGRADDTGGAMRKNPRQIDVFKHTHKEAMDWGRRKVIVVWRKSQTECS